MMPIRCLIHLMFLFGALRAVCADDLVLRNGDRLRGDLVRAGEGELLFQPKWGDRPLALRAEDFWSLRLPSVVTPSSPKEFVRCHFRNGDQLTVLPVAMSAEEVELRTLWGERVVARRSAISSFEDFSGASLLASAPADPAGWRSRPGGIGQVVGGLSFEPEPSFREDLHSDVILRGDMGVLLRPKASFFETPPLPDSMVVEIKFVQPAADNNVRFTMFTRGDQPWQSQEGVLLQFDRNSLYMRHPGPGGLQNWRERIAMGTREHVVRLYLDRKAGKGSLWYNGNKARNFEIAMDDSLNFLDRPVFSVAVLNARGAAVLNDFRIRRWLGPPMEEVEPLGPGGVDRVLQDDGVVMDGRVVGMDAEGWRVETGEGMKRVPLGRAARICLSGPDPASLPAPAYRMHLSPAGDRMGVDEPRATKTEFNGESANWVLAPCPPHEWVRLLRRTEVRDPADFPPQTNQPFFRMLNGDRLHGRWKGMRDGRAEVLLEAGGTYEVPVRLIGHYYAMGKREGAPRPEVWAKVGTKDELPLSEVQMDADGLRGTFLEGMGVALPLERLREVEWIHAGEDPLFLGAGPLSEWSISPLVQNLPCLVATPLAFGIDLGAMCFLYRDLPPCGERFAIELELEAPQRGRNIQIRLFEREFRSPQGVTFLLIGNQLLVRTTMPGSGAMAGNLRLPLEELLSPGLVRFRLRLEANVPERHFSLSIDGMPLGAWTEKGLSVEDLRAGRGMTILVPQDVAPVYLRDLRIDRCLEQSPSAPVPEKEGVLTLSNGDGFQVESVVTEEGGLRVRPLAGGKPLVVARSNVRRVFFRNTAASPRRRTDRDVSVFLSGRGGVTLPLLGAEDGHLRLDARSLGGAEWFVPLSAIGQVRFNPHLATRMDDEPFREGPELPPEIELYGEGMRQ